MTTTPVLLRGPTDMLAMIPVLLGFTPSHSLVMLTFGAPATFHARVDFPPSGQHDRATQSLLEPCVRHNVPTVLIVHYTDSREDAAAVQDTIERTFMAAGIDVLEGLWVSDGHYLSLVHQPEGEPVPYDNSTHPLTMQMAVEKGAAPMANREQLRERLEPAEEVCSAANIEGHFMVAQQRTIEAMDLDYTRETITEALEREGTMHLDEVATLVCDLNITETRDVALTMASRDNAREMLALWVEVVRHTPPSWQGYPLLMCAHAAWLTGDGAMAWVALDRYREVTDGKPASLYLIVTALLENAVHPDNWDTMNKDI